MVSGSVPGPGSRRFPVRTRSPGVRPGPRRAPSCGHGARCPRVGRAGTAAPERSRPGPEAELFLRFLAVRGRGPAGDPGTVPILLRGAGALPGPGRTAAAVFSWSLRCSESQSGCLGYLHGPVLGWPHSTGGLGAATGRAVGLRKTLPSAFYCPSYFWNLGNFKQPPFSLPQIRCNFTGVTAAR